MCFSLTADVIAGTAVGAIGIDTWRRADSPAERTLAAVPTVLGAHLLVEALVWWHLDGGGSETIGTRATWAYLIVAFLVVPILIPAALAVIEPSDQRRRMMLPLIGLGTFAAGALFNGMLTGPVRATVEGHHISYRTGLDNGGIIVAMYVVAACGAALLASDRRIVLFGLANVVAVAALAWLQSSALISLWCAWAAVTSIAIGWRVRDPRTAGSRRHEDLGDHAPATRRFEDAAH